MHGFEASERSSVLEQVLTMGHIVICFGQNFPTCCQSELAIPLDFGNVANIFSFLCCLLYNTPGFSYLAFGVYPNPLIQ